MTTITETETETETKKIEQTKTIEKVKCDVCGHEYESDEWSGREFSVDPDINREAHAIGELNELFDAYHVEITRQTVEDYDGREELTFDVPKRELFDVLNEEIPIAMERQEKPTKTRIASAGLREEYADELGTRNFYIKNDTIHHFMYRLNVEASSKDHKHVCDSCYDVIFD